MKTVSLILLSLFVLTGCRVSPNFYEWDEGQVFRSAQLTKKELENYHQEHRFKTIINLRGESTKDWYKDEKAFAQENGINLINIKMSAQRYPHKEDLAKLLDSLRDAERPILVHCQGGADRTGEAMAIYSMEYMGWSKKDALKKALSFKYFHIEKKMPAKRAFIRKWEGLDWAYNEYDPCLLENKHYNKEKYCQD